MTEILRVALFYNNKVFLYVECRPLKAASNKVVSAAKGKPQNRNFSKQKHPFTCHLTSFQQCIRE